MKSQAVHASTFNYTRNVLPKKNDTTLTKVAKYACIILSLGTLLVATFAIDLCEKFSKKSVDQIIAENNKNLTKKQKAEIYAEEVYQGAKKGFGDIFLIPKKMMGNDKDALKSGALPGFMLGSAALLGLVGGKRGIIVAFGASIAGIFAKPIIGAFQHRSN